MVFRSLLFVPGARPDRFDKAVASGADAVCIDLEDAVAPHLKQEARATTFEYLATPSDAAAVGFRMNGLDTQEGSADLAAFRDSRAMPAFIMIPKASGGGDINHVRETLGADCPPLWPLIETPEGLLNGADIARAVGDPASKGGGVMFGGADYSASIGSDMSWDALAYARGAIVNAAAVGGCDTLDVPYLDVRNEEGLRGETLRVKSLGFTGRACIHPAQINTVNAVFTPSAEEISKAEKIAAAYEAAAGGVALLDGKLIEKPVLRAAERVLACKRD